MKTDDSHIKVLRIITRLNVGGPSRQIDSLVTYLSRTHFSHSVVAGSVTRGEIEHEIAVSSRIKLHRVPELGRSVNLLSDVRALISIIRIIRIERPAIVHTHLAKAGLLGRLAAFACRVPIRIHTFHGHLLHGYFTGIRLKSYIILERLLKLITTYQICVGEEVRQNLVKAKIVDQSSSLAVYPGIQAPTLTSRESARKQLDVGSEAFIVLFVGRLVDVKRLDRFIDVINQTSKLVPSLLAIVVGDGPSRKSVEGLIDSSAEVRFEGWQRDLGVYFSASDVVCLTSDNEGMPIALIEAALCGVPAIASNVGSTKEVVIDGRTGFVVEADDIATYVSRLVELSSDKTLRQLLSQNATNFGLTTFEPRLLARKHEDIYQSLFAEMQM